MTPAEKANKVRSNDRVLVLKPIEGEKTLSSTGLVDPRLFSGENRLHVKCSPNNMWYFKYEQGIVPEPLKERFTSFPAALEKATKYFKSRNINVEKIID